MTAFYRAAIRALLLLGAAPVAFGPGATAARAQAALDPWLRTSLAAPAGLLRTTPGGAVSLIVTTDDGAALSRSVRRLGGSVRSLTGRVATLRLPADRLRDLARVPGVRQIHRATAGLLGATDGPMLDRSTGVGTLSGPGGLPIYLGTRADLTQARGITGSGVLVGVIDQGIAYTHPDFRRADNTSRLLVLWDQTVNNAADTLNNNRAVTPTAPSYPYGREWSAAEINAGVVTQTANGHGTNVPGIAVGNGRSNSALVAMAPEADLLYVKTTYELADVIDALTYLVRKAEAMGRPIVVNYSGGGHFGAHDGTRPDELAMDDLAAPGVLFVAAGGNSGGQPIHASHGFVGSQPDTLTATQSSTIFAVDLWVPGEIPVNLTAISPNGTVYGPIPPDSVRFYVQTATTELVLANLTNSSPNGDRELIVETIGTTPTGTWRVILTPTGATSARPWHGWAYAGNTTLSRFLDPSVTVTMPSTGNSALGVGAYTLNNGYLWSSSSLGPTRDGRIKPDLVAPTGVVAPLPGGVYGSIGNGTSSSAPHVTGALALALELNPLLDPTTARAAFSAHALVDPATGAVPNTSYGYGKLNADLVAADVPLPVELAGFSATAVVAGVQLGWQTHAERDLLGFTLDRSSGSGWVRVADFRTAPALRAAGSSAAPQSYAHVDGRGRAGDRYRLGAVDVGGAEQVLAERTVAHAADGSVPSRFALLPAAPNPFNPETEIRYQLLTPGAVRLDVYDTLGRRIATLVDRPQSAGSYRAVFSGTGLPSGIYTLRLTAPDGVRMRRATLVK